MEMIYFLVGVAVLLLGQILFFFLLRSTLKGRNTEKMMRRDLDLLRGQMADLTKSFDRRMGESSRLMNESVRDQFTQSKKLIEDITKRLGEVQETNKQIYSFTDSLSNLEKVLTHQKQRGELGERGLKLILENILPPGIFTMQYRFENGEVVDAIIKAEEGIIPIDAKFSLDNYNRLLKTDESEPEYDTLVKSFKSDLKKRIDETAKYIRPSEGTLDFALMYIPAEGIYYDLLVAGVGAGKVNTRNLIEYAQKKKVIVVSPTTLVAYLSTILHGFRAFKIEKRTEDIKKQVASLERHLQSYVEAHERLGKSLGAATNHFNRSSGELKKISRDTAKITGDSTWQDELILEEVTGIEN